MFNLIFITLSSIIVIEFLRVLIKTFIFILSGSVAISLLLLIVTQL